MQNDFDLLCLLVRCLTMLLKLTPALIDAWQKNWAKIKPSGKKQQRKRRKTPHNSHRSKQG